MAEETTPEAAYEAKLSDESGLNYRLIYFDIRGRAEHTRLAFHLGGLAFDDVRVTREQWNALKPKCPFGQLPILEVNGKILAQSNAILRFVGKKTGLYPTNHFEAACVDEVIDVIEDINWRIIPTIKEKDMEKKMAARRELATKLLPKWLALLDAKFNAGYVLGEKESIADLATFNLIEWLRMGVIDGIPKTIVDKHKNLKALQEKIHKHPKLQAYFEEHYGKDPVLQAKRFASALERLVDSYHQPDGNKKDQSKVSPDTNFSGQTGDDRDPKKPKI